MPPAPEGPPRRLHCVPTSQANRPRLNAALKPYWVEQRIVPAPKMDGLQDAYLCLACVDNDTWAEVKRLGTECGFEMWEG